LTFSVVARDPRKRALGVAVATGVPAVGSVVPHVQLDVGAIATQAYTDPRYGTEGLELLKKGIPPQKVLEIMLKKDESREKRQVIIIDAQGRTAAFTGNETEEWKGHHVGKDYVVAGNTLSSTQVIEAMSHAFEKHTGSLAERLLKALEVGQKAGGDKRGHMSAALKVADEAWISSFRPVLDLRVDAHMEPVKELRRVYAVSARYFHVSE
jgi:uncharacterized Ntn-hydrolase superfamily protein